MEFYNWSLEDRANELEFLKQQKEFDNKISKAYKYAEEVANRKFKGDDK